MKRKAKLIGIIAIAVIIAIALSITACPTEDDSGGGGGSLTKVKMDDLIAGNYDWGTVSGAKASVLSITIQQSIELYGSMYDAKELVLDIAKNVKVVVSGTIESAAGFTGTMIELTGTENSTFEIKAGAEITNANGTTIKSTGSSGAPGPAIEITGGAANAVAVISGKIDGAVSVINKAVLSVKELAALIVNSLTIDNGGSVAVNGTLTNIDNTITNSGAITISLSGSLDNDGAITNNALGIITNHGTINNNGTFVNNGIIYSELSNITGTPIDGTITPPAVITITTHPTAVTTVTQGSISGSLTVAATVTSDAKLSYQWYINTSATNDSGTPVSGATGASFSIPKGLSAGTYYYFCEVRANLGAAPRRTTVATVTVDPPASGTVIAITGHPAASTTVIEGAITGSLSVTVTVFNPAATIEYRWMSNTTNSNEGGSQVTGAANNRTFPIPTNLVADQSPYYYYCIVIATLGGDSYAHFSNVATVTVNSSGGSAISIADAAALAKIGIDSDYPRNGNYIQTNHIDLSGYDDWTPIGTLASYFSGTYDGGGYTITGLKITTGTNAKGLFGYMSGTVKKVGIDCNINTSSTGALGGLVGYNTGTIESCFVTGSIITNGPAGGIVGNNYSGTILNCYSEASVSSPNEAGGIAGYNGQSGTLRNCYSTGAISVSNDYAGGVAGSNEGGTIRECIALNSSVTTGAGSNIGRIIGYNEGTNIFSNYARNDMPLNGETVPAANASNTNKEGYYIIIGTGDLYNLVGGLMWIGTGFWSYPSENMDIGSALPTLLGFLSTQYPVLPAADIGTP